MKDRGRTKYTVLGMLGLGSLTGYEIIKIIQTSTNFFWSESEGQIYPALAQCVEDGLATCKEKKSEKTQREKKVYSITAKGKKLLTSWLKKETQPTLVRNELLLKLFLGHNTDVKDNIHHVIHHQKQITVELESYEKLQESLSNQYKDSPHLKYWLITLNYGIRILKAKLAWCKETLSILEAK